MIDPILSSLPSHNRIDHVQALRTPHVLSNDDGPMRSTNLLLDLVSRAKNTLENSHASVMRHADNLSLQKDLKPEAMLLLQHRMAIYSAQLMIIKQTGEEIGRGINSIVNR